MSEKIILVVDDEEHILQMLKMNMKTRGYGCITAKTGEEAVELARSEKPDLILLDVMLPGKSGVETCRILKSDRETGRIPVLMVSAKSEGKDKITGLRGGADDYITKPFNLEELFLRIGASLRQVDLLSSGAEPQIIEQGSLLLDGDKYQVSSRGEKIDLTPTEFRILRLLLKNRGRTVSRDRIISDIFEMPPSEMGRTLDVHLRNIRKKLDSCNVENCAIETVRGQGFKIG